MPGKRISTWGVWGGGGRYAVILAAVLLFGGIRLALNSPTGETVKVAVLTTNVNKEYWPDGEDTPLDKGLIAGTLTRRSWSVFPARWPRSTMTC